MEKSIDFLEQNNDTHDMEIEALRMQVHQLHRQASRMSNRGDRLRLKLRAYELSARLWRLLGGESDASFYDDNILLQRDAGWATFHEGEANGRHTE